jgi:hypothetical protein
MIPARGFASVTSDGALSPLLLVDCVATISVRCTPGTNLSQDPMPQNPLTLTRQSLYELVWSKPMSTLANDFGISDVGLAKRCRAVDVPIPYRGYWARKAAGQEPPKLPLPKYRTRTPAPTTAADRRVPPKVIIRDGREPVVNFDRSTDPLDVIRRRSLIPLALPAASAH